MASKAHPSKTNQPGKVMLTIQQAVANSNMPNRRSIPSIQGPALGINTPDEAPTSNSSKPCPQAMANKALPPSTTSPVCEINSNTPANGAATQGPTMSAEIIPMRNTPP